jgi:hypothetical protein
VETASAQPITLAPARTPWRPEAAIARADRGSKREPDGAAAAQTAKRYGDTLSRRRARATEDSQSVPIEEQQRLDAHLEVLTVTASPATQASFRT